MINAAALLAQTKQLWAALDQRRLLPANDNDPPDPPPATSLRLPRIHWMTVSAFGLAA